jgi:hypothetical protein
MTWTASVEGMMLPQPESNLKQSHADWIAGATAVR